MISEVDSDDGGHINLTEFIELKTKLRCLPWWRWILFRVQLNKLVDVNVSISSESCGCNYSDRDLKSIVHGAEIVVSNCSLKALLLLWNAGCYYELWITVTK
ncbi:hypothetical protein JHK86_018914 [Glycine max]|nr:hypothetical protein JHK86_018914 [Glycine max]